MCSTELSSVSVEFRIIGVPNLQLYTHWIWWYIPTKSAECVVQYLGKLCLQYRLISVWLAFVHLNNNLPGVWSSILALSAAMPDTNE